MLNTIEDSPFLYSGRYIRAKFNDYISQYERIGYYKCDNKQIDILIVHLKKTTSLERARTMQRNFVADYLNAGRGDKLRDAALVAFVSPPDGEDWRFSLVEMDYRYDEKKEKIEEEFTPARRWSFLVGANERSHTAQAQLYPIILDDEHNPTLNEIEKAFDIETVTKEFFLKYRKLFIQTKDALDEVIQSNEAVRTEFDAKDITTVDFAKKLLGQIVFLYFIQKKGWLGVPEHGRWGSGSKHFLRDMFDRKYINYDNFFNDILKPLFYDTLSVDRSNSDYWSRKFKCKIPFLNGGLFESIGGYEWYKTTLQMDIPNTLFSNDNITKEGDSGDGVLDVFDRFNFTVDEDSPIEKEVAIDPEMLGKIFEKLGGITQDNYAQWAEAVKTGNKHKELEANKKLGVYYTPREIVHYMCQQSLVSYISSVVADVPEDDIKQFIQQGELYKEHNEAVNKTADKINKGSIKKSKYSGYKTPSTVISNADKIDKAIADIKICDPAIGSGAFPIGMLHEITKLRTALTPHLPPSKNRTPYNFKRECIENSLYGVDIERGAVEIAKLRFWLSLIVDEDDIHKIKPLPNLDYKVVCGNSLLGVERDVFNVQSFDRLEELKKLYFNEIHSTKKSLLKEEIDELIDEITGGRKQFDFRLYFSEVFHEKGGFDVVIANPPYGAKYSKENKMYFLNHFESTKTISGIQKGSLNTFSIFIEQGFNVLKKQGNLIYIVPIAITSSDSMTALHNILEKNCNEIKISSYAVRPQPVFKNAVVDTSILFFIKTMSQAEKILCTKMYRKGKGFNLQSLLENLEFIDVKKYKLRGRYPKVSLPIETEILGKLFSLKFKVRNLIRNDGKPIYYRFAGGRYFKVVTNYSTGSSAEKSVCFDPKTADCIGAILSSNLFFWFYQIYSDNLNLKSYEIESFPIPLEKLTDDKIKGLEKLYRAYLDDIEKNVNIRETTRYANITSFREYKIVKSKNLIDVIDDFIGPLYSLNEEEIEFIKNYEIKFRLSEKENNENV